MHKRRGFGRGDFGRMGIVKIWRGVGRAEGGFLGESRNVNPALRKRTRDARAIAQQKRLLPREPLASRGSELFLSH